MANDDKKRARAAQKRALKAKKKAKKKTANAPVRVAGAMPRTYGMADLVAGDVVPLSAALIEELVSRKGWDRTSLVEAMEDGGRYSPSRNSLFFPDEADF